MNIAIIKEEGKLKGLVRFLELIEMEVDFDIEDIEKFPYLVMIDGEWKNSSDTLFCGKILTLENLLDEYNKGWL